MSAPSVLSIVKISLCHLCLEHLLQADRLCTKLQFIHIVFLWCPMLIFHRNRLPFPLISKKLHAIFILMKLYHITLPTESKFLGRNPQSSHHQKITSLLKSPLIMCFLVHQLTGSCPLILCPLLFDMYHRPLSSTKGKMLNTGQHKIIFF